MKNLAACAIILAAMAGNVNAADCDGTYRGYMAGELVNEKPIVSSGALTDIFSENGFTYLKIANVWLQIQSTNIISLEFDNYSCTFFGSYNADKLFNGHFE